MPFRTKLIRRLTPILEFLRALALAAATPLLEKNPTKADAARSIYVPLVFSMARLIILGFAVAMIHQIVVAGIAGWPDATLSIAIVLALPIVSALERARSSDVIALSDTLLKRFGVGATRPRGPVFAPVEPSKYDDHRADDPKQVTTSSTPAARRRKAA
jgi:hypothetical protein